MLFPFEVSVSLDGGDALTGSSGVSHFLVSPSPTIVTMSAGGQSQKLVGGFPLTHPLGRDLVPSPGFLI